MEKIKSFGQQLLQIVLAVVSLAILGCGWVNVGFFGYVILFFAMITIVDLCLIFFDRETDGSLVFFDSFGEALLRCMFACASLTVIMFVGQYIYLCATSTAEIDVFRFGIFYWLFSGMACLLHKSFHNKSNELFLA